MTCCALCVVRVQRGLRGAAVMCSLATARLFARALQVRCSAAARAARAAWRCKLRVGAADCIAGGCKGCIRAAEQRFCNRFQQRAVWTTQWCCTRARGGRGLRDAELHVVIWSVRQALQDARASRTSAAQDEVWRRHRSKRELAGIPTADERTRGTRLSSTAARSALQHRRTAVTRSARSVFGPRLLRTTNEAVAAPVAPS